jgi:hypothetical protein
MAQPSPTDPAGVWQAWVADARTRDERLRRFEFVPAALRTRVASHMRTVQALEAYHAKRK